MMDRRFFRNIDFWMIFATLSLVGIGILIIGSATHINTPSEDRFWYVQRQGLFALINLVLILVMLKFDYRILGPLGNILYLSLIHISEPTRRTPISYAVFCLKKK